MPSSTPPNFSLSLIAEQKTSEVAETKALSESAPRVHLGYLDSLRAIAAIYVVVHHVCFKLFDGVYLVNPISRRLVQLFWFGHFAVNFFIVLSGFCLMLPIVRGNGQIRGGLGAFFERRAWRILPPYYASLVLSLGIIFLFGQQSGAVLEDAIPVTIPNVLTHLLVMHDLFNSHAFKMNPVFWSIAIEWHIYFVFPLLLILWRRLGLVKTLVFAIFVSTVASMLVENFWFWKTNLYLHYIGLFALGMGASAAAFRESSRAFYLARRVTWAIVTPISTLLICVLAYYSVSHSWLPAPIIDPIVGAWSALILLHVALNGDGALRHVLDWKPLVFIGSFSYSIYLVHYPIIQLVRHFGTSQFEIAPFNEFLLLIAVGTPISMITAYGFFLVVEKPFMTFKRRRMLAKP